jgi:MFS family permease
MIADSAIIILFASMLGASDMVSMVTTSLISVSNCLLLLPFAIVANKFGYKKTIIRSTVVSFLLIALVASSAWFPTTLAKPILLLSLGLFCISLTLYVAAWFPMLSTFLTPKTRSRFFGKLRFSWQLTSVLFFLICGAIIGEKPPIWMLQLLIFITGIALLGRIVHIRRIPEFAEIRNDTLKFKEGLMDALNNKPLCGFSVYICCLYLAAYATLPLTYIYLKKMDVADNTLVIISSAALAGTMIGFLFAGRLVDKFGVKKLMLFIHFSFAIINLILFFIGSISTIVLFFIGALVTVYGFFIACSSVAISSEMMAMASPNNKAVSMAFCGTFYSAGMGGSRLLTSLVIGSGLLAKQWHIGSMQINHYQTLFLIFGSAIANTY